MSLLARVVGRLSDLCGLLAIVCLVAACVVVCQLVFMRYVLEASTIWQTEFVLYSVVAATLLGSPRVLRDGGHVGVDLLGEMLGERIGERARRVQQFVAAVLGLVFVLILAWSGTRYFLEAWEGGWVTESVWAPPLWLLLLPLPVGLGVLSLQYLVEIGRLVTGRRLSERDA